MALEVRFTRKIQMLQVVYSRAVIFFGLGNDQTFTKFFWQSDIIQYYGEKGSAIYPVYWQYTECRPKKLSLYR